MENDMELTKENVLAFVREQDKNLNPAGFEIIPIGDRQDMVLVRKRTQLWMNGRLLHRSYPIGEGWSIGIVQWYREELLYHQLAGSCGGGYLNIKEIDIRGPKKLRDDWWNVVVSVRYQDSGNSFDDWAWQGMSVEPPADLASRE